MMLAASVVDDASEVAPRIRVLLVDDDAIAVHGVVRLLDRHECDVIAVAGVQEARQMLAGGGFDVVVTQVWVHDGTGIEVFDAARAAGVKSVVFLGGGPSLPARLAVPGGSVRYVCKNVEASTLVEAVTTCCPGYLLFKAV